MTFIIYININYIFITVEENSSGISKRTLDSNLMANEEIKSGSKSKL